MATLKTISTFEANDIEVTLFKSTRRDKSVSYVVDVFLVIEQHCITDFRSKDVEKAQVRYDDLVQAVKDGWYP